MKHTTLIPLLYFLAFSTLLFPACTSVQELVESGNYEETIRLAQDRLTGKQKKDPKLVAALETAFNKVTAEDLETARRLSEGGNTDWPRVHSIYDRMLRRQDALKPLLPLTDKRGYQAEFRFARVDGLMDQAAENAAAQIYDQGLRLLETGRAGDKASARAAYAEFERIPRYRRNYRNTEQLQLEAEQLGIVHIAVAVLNRSGGYLPRGFEEELLRVRTSGMDDQWRVYDFSKSPTKSYDYDAQIVIRDIQVSPERVNERTYIDEKEITDGTEYVLDGNGNVAKDSLGNDITRPRQVIVRADVIEVLQTKSALVSGSLVLYDNVRQRVVEEEDLTAEAIFENYASTFRGDRRALSNDSRRNIGNQPTSFPTDEQLILDAAEALKPQLQDRLAKSYRTI